MLNDKRIKIVSGHYGSGKTEFSINYAVKLAQMGKKTAIADLDVVNLYFRTRDREDILEDMGITIIGSSVSSPSLDIPSISSKVYNLLKNESYEIILDLGGNPQGARVMGRYQELLKDGDYDMFFILNANRPETQKVEDVLVFMERIQDIARLRFTGIVNNTHMLKTTSLEDILKGYRLAKEVSNFTGIPIKYNAGLESLIKSIDMDLEGELFPIKLYMREEWMV